MSCSRNWQAEAHVDGRLDPSERASFERHAEGCRECQDELASLRALVERIAALPVPERTELERRRQRTELQRRAHQALVTRAPATNLRLAFAAVLVVCLSIVTVFALRRPKAPAFEVVDLAQAEWSLESRDATSRVKLRGGTASFHVEHLQGGARFVVELPDGRIEVRGTRFVVNVVLGHTRSVVVTEGTVLLQVPGFDGLLQAGERWPAVSAPPPSASTTIVDAAPATLPSASIAPAPVSSPSSIASPSKPLPGPRFADAMTAFSSGDYARADQLFAGFVRDFPGDARAEDAMFLRAESRSRLGDKAGAALLARRYLDSYPNGLRRPEAKRLAGD